jgi:hypothetical protein
MPEDTIQSKGTYVSHSDHEDVHRTVLVQIGPWRELIDEVIAPLIREMWIAGIQTVMSCQGDENGTVWIAFDDLENLAAFLNIVARYEAGAETLYNRINYQLSLDDPELVWEYGLIVNDGAALRCESQVERADGELHPGAADFFFTVSVRFPRCELSAVFSRMQQHNRQWNAQADKAASDDTNCDVVPNSTR